MNLFEQTLQDFASSLGMEQVSLSGGPQARSLFKIENIGLLELEYVGQTQEKVGISLTAQVERVLENEIRRILQETHYRQARSYPVNAFLGSQGSITFTAVVSAYDFTLPTLHSCLETLNQLFDQLNPYLRLSR